MSSRGSGIRSCSWDLRWGRSTCCRRDCTAVSLEAQEGCMESLSVIGPCVWRYEIPAPGTHAFQLCKSSASHHPSLGHGSHIDLSLCCLVLLQLCGSADRHPLPASYENKVDGVSILLLTYIPRAYHFRNAYET